MRWVRMALTAGIALLAVTSVAAQSGGLNVVVTDNEGLPLPGATVTISHETGYVKTTAQLSNKDGRAEFPVLRPGAGYSVEVAFPGFNTIRQDGLRVRVNQQQKIPVQMIEEFQERVKVTAESEVIDLDQTSQTTKFSENFISDLPVPGRFYTNVLTMAPGVQDADGDGNPNVHGSRSRDLNVQVSGVSNVDPLTGRLMSRINPNSIEEIEVITAGAGVEFGRAQGGFARIIQKQGSNTHEGVAEFYYRTSKLDGRGGTDESGIDDLDYTWYQPSLQLSGPVVKDKLWYRASLEDRDIDDPINVASAAARSRPSIEEKTRTTPRSPGRCHPATSWRLQYRHDPRRNVDNFGVSSFVDSGPLLAVPTRTRARRRALTWTAPYSPEGPRREHPGLVGPQQR